MDQILYIFDPLCGWCFGFSETMLDFSEKHAGKYEFVPVVGGMMTGPRVAPYASMAEYIKSSLPRLEVTTGTTFGEPYIQNFLEGGSALTDSEPPCRALITFRSFMPESAMEFAHSLQNAHFKDGMDYNDDALYGQLSESFGLDSKTFMERFHSNEIKQTLEEEFTWVKKSGVQGFPTVVYHSGQKYFLINHGYTSLETMEESLKRAMVNAV